MPQSPLPLTADFLLERALQLSVPERIELIQRISDSLPPDAEHWPLSDARRAELRRRAAHLAAHPEDRLTWDQVESAVR